MLGETEEAIWRERHQTLSATRTLAGLFRGWVPEKFAAASCRILYVGKATSNSFEGLEPERTYFNGSGTFWAFAKQIAAATNCIDQSLSCVAWSNVSKISLPQVAADRWVIEGFEEEAAATLEAEIAKLHPNIVVFVSGHFSEEIVRLVANATDDQDWNKSENESNDSEVGDVWWTAREDGRPALWMRHPQGSNLKLRGYAAEKIASLCRVVDGHV